VIALLLAFALHRTPARFYVRFDTSQGAFTVEVTRDWAPRGADRFYELVRNRFFDGQKFFRVRAGFIAQFGLHPDPKVIAKWKHRTIPDDPVTQSNVRGTLAYAMTGPDTRSTQIYINLADNARLDKEGFAQFGRVVEGMDVVDHLYSGYGESAGGGMRGGKQGPIEAGGNEYLDKNFPKLDFIKTARLADIGPTLSRPPGPTESRSYVSACSSRGPAEVPSAEEVEVDVEDGLAGGFAGVDDHAVAVRREFQVARDLRGAQQHVSDDRVVLIGHLVERRDVFARNDEDVRRRLRVDVVERDDLVVFVHFFCRDLARRDAAEEAAVVTSHARIIR